MKNLNAGIHPGTKLSVLVTEPWEIVSALPNPMLEGIVLNADHQKGVVFRLNRPVTYGDSMLTCFLAFPRHMGDQFANETGNVFCNLVSLNEAEAEKGTPLNPSELRGSLMLIGDVSW